MYLLGSLLSLPNLPSNLNLPTLNHQCNDHLLRQRSKLDLHSLILQKCRLGHLLRDPRSLESKATLLRQSKIVTTAHPCHLYHTSELASHHSCHKEVPSELLSLSATPELHHYRIRSSRITGRPQAPL